MGASDEMGRDESCIRGSALSSVVQSIYRTASEAPDAATARSPWRVRVFCLRKRAMKLSGAEFLVCAHLVLRWTPLP